MEPCHRYHWALCWSLSVSSATGSVAASPAPGAVSCRRHIESAGSGLSILQRRKSSRGPPAAAAVPRFLSTASDPAAGHRLPLRFLDSPTPEPALVMSPAAAPALRSSGTGHSRGPPAAGPAPRSPAPDPAANLHTIGEWWVATKALANGGVRLVGGVQAESWRKKLQRNVLQLRSRTHVEAYVDHHRHQDRCQCHQEPDRDGSHYPQRQPSGEADRLVVAGPASWRTTPTPTWNVSRDKILVWWWRRAHRSTPPPPRWRCAHRLAPPQSKFLRRGPDLDIIFGVNKWLNKEAGIIYKQLKIFDN